MQAQPFPPKALDERRQLPRQTFTDAVQFRRLLKPSEKYSGSLARDISAGGVRIRSSVPLAKEDRLVVLLSLPGAGREIRAISRVAWNSERPFGSGFETGLQFIEILPEDKDSIAGYVERGVTVPSEPASQAERRANSAA